MDADITAVTHKLKPGTVVEYTDAYGRPVLCEVTGDRGPGFSIHVRILGVTGDRGVVYFEGHERDRLSVLPPAGDPPR